MHPRYDEVAAIARTSLSLPDDRRCSSHVCIGILDGSRIRGYEEELGGGDAIGHCDERTGGCKLGSSEDRADLVIGCRDKPLLLYIEGPEKASADEGTARSVLPSCIHFNIMAQNSRAESSPGWPLSNPYSPRGWHR